VFFASASGIQIATLIVAALAVISSFAGPYYVARFSTRAEHRVWQRGLRVRIYGELAQSADEYSELLSRTPPANREERLVAVLALSNKVTEVDTFGSISVSTAALEVLRQCAVTTVDTSEEQRQVAMHSITEYRKTVRSSLGISDD
jgi:hypothetical protein